MTRTISLIIGIAVTALVVAVPTALGEGMLAGSQKQDGVAYFYANERASMTGPSSAPLVSRPDSHELTQQQGTPVVSRPDSHETIQPFAYIDAADRAARVRTVPSSDVVLLSGDDHTTFAPVDSATPVASSGRDLDWPQVGIGLGIGIALAFGLILALRATRQRPLAH
jgi:hypothetical protein